MKVIHSRSILLLVLLFIAVAEIGAYFVWPYLEEITWDLDQARDSALNFLSSIPPYLYFVAFAVLPAFGVPLSLFYLTALPVLSPSSTITGLFLAYLALAINITLTGVLTRTLLHPTVERLIKKRGLSVPKINQANEWQIVLALRISPIPFPLQNYLLAMGHARWRYYLGLSLLIQCTIGTVVMLVGVSILKGGLGFALLGIFLFLLINIVFQTIQKRLKVAKATDNVTQP